jgi:ADP-ribosyl-[dinitrogen reductase] hydrolase
LAASSPSDLPAVYLHALERLLGQNDAGFLALARLAAASAGRGETTETFAASLGAGERVSGYVLQTVPVALHAWFCFPQDYRQAVLAVIQCGGDTDTTAAIVGAIVGASVGPVGIPSAWQSSLWEWPRSVAWMTRLGTQLASACTDGSPQRPLSLPFLPLLLRNAFFTTVVLAHGFRRLLPPY